MFVILVPAAPLYAIGAAIAANVLVGLKQAKTLQKIAVTQEAMLGNNVGMFESLQETLVSVRKALDETQFAVKMQEEGVSEETTPPS